MLKKAGVTMSTIKDVAREAGVSIATVSRVLNNNNYISEPTRKKVVTVMENLDYHPHQIARALSKKESYIIGAIMPDSSHSFFAQLVKSIEKTAELKGYKVMLCNSMNDKEKELSYINMLKENRVDGIIVGSHASDTQAYKNLKKAIITFDRYFDDTIPYVACDNFSGGQLATKHLIEAGCQKLLHISGPLGLTTYANRRAEAFKLTCIENNIPYEIIEYQNTQLTFDYFYSFIEKIAYKHLDQVDGVFCSSDILAYALYVYCINHDIAVPSQIKIVGYDYCQFARTLKTPKLTTIAQPIDLIGQVLCTSLIQLIKHEETYSQQLAVTLIKGDTT